MTNEPRRRMPGLGLALWLAALPLIPMSASAGLIDVGVLEGGLSPSRQEKPAPETPSENADAKPAAPRFVLVEGQITDSIGAGQAGVTVTVRKVSADDKPGPVIATATTDELGDFAVTLDQPLSGEFTVVFAKPRFGELTRTVRVKPDAKMPPYIAEALQGDQVLAGRAVDARTQSPVKEGKVTVRSMALNRTEDLDDEGRFSFPAMSPGRAEVTVEAPSFGRERVIVEDIEEADEVVVLLKPQRTLKLLVVDERDQPVSAAAIEAYDQPRDDFRSLFSDEQGRAVLTGLHFDVGRMTFRINREGHIASRGFDHQVDLPADELESEHKLVLPRGGAIEGTIIAADNRRPVSGARVTVGMISSDDSPRDWTSFDGRYTVRGVPPGQAVVTVHAVGHAPELKTVDIEAGQARTLDFTLGAPHTVRGVVLEGDDQPVSGAEVRAELWRGHGTLGLRAMTNRQGEFSIENAPADGFNLMVLTREHGPSITTTRGDAPTPVTIRLQRLEPAKSPSDIDPANAPPAPELTLTTHDGRKIELAALKGKYVLIDFWATWCAPCIEELDHFITLHERHGHRDDFIIIGISRDFDEKSFLNLLESRPKIRWPQVYGDAGGVPNAVKAFNVSWIPRAILISPEGTILADNIRGERIVTELEKLLKERAGP